MNKGFFKQDYFRYYGTKIHSNFVKHYFTNHSLRFLFFLRASQNIRLPVVRQLAQLMRFLSSNKYGLEIPASTQIGKGLYLGHAYGITINPGAVLGDNINLHKGVTIGRENRGKRQGVPSIGNQVWIGVNATIVGKVTIGEDVLIAPNAFVNVDVPPHSIVIGNPCSIIHRENATEEYINRMV